MSDQTKGGIAWTDETWNPIRGCSRVSPGCEHCYAESVAARFSGPGLAYEGLARRAKNGEPRWTGAVRMVPEHLADPLRWTKPRRVFVNSMSDLFHEKLSNEQIAAVFGVMAAAPGHTFQVLTKRARRMWEWFEWVDKRAEDGLSLFPNDPAGWRIRQMLNVEARRAGADVPSNNGGPWPLPNVWLGVSAENQETADERVPELLDTPAAVRWVSAEPLIGPVDVFAFLKTEMRDRCLRTLTGGGDPVPGIDWVVVGGESGKKARSFDLAWARSIRDECASAKVPFFMKQLGARPIERLDAPVMLRVPFEADAGGAVTGGGAITHRGIELRDGHGGDPGEWPEDLRIREFPA